MLQTIRNAWKIPELRAKLLFTIVIILLYRFGAQVPVPYIDATALGEWFSQQGDTIFGYMNILSGDAFSKATLFALSITPYITASIVMQLLTIAIPALERMQKEGDDGKKKITQITRYVTVLLGIITGYGYYIVCRNMGLITYPDNVFVAIVIVTCYSAGSALIMWMGERINDKGIGNGISIILFFNIIASLPGYVVNSITRIIANPINAIELVVIAAISLVLIALVVFVTNAERRLSVQYAKRVVGRKMYGGQSTHLPMKVNMSGVMPIIFASSIASLPITIISFINSNPEKGTFLYGLTNFFSTKSAFYPVVMFLLIIAFAFFYIAISFNPVEVANNLKKNGGFITGIRPGKPTSDYIARILNKLTLIGGIFLGVIAVFPFVVNAIVLLLTKTSIGAIAFGGSSIIIVVGVVLDTTKDIEAQMTMRHYKGFLE
ncbi:MAG: preprotein translocase subunit SecY [Eubacteriales bacterium]